MLIDDLPAGWPSVRATLQGYGAAMTAFPRAGATPDPHWSHVSLDPIPGGFAATPTPLADGTRLGSILDLSGHRLIGTAGDQSAVVDLTGGPSPATVGNALMGLADRHGGIEVEERRFDETARQPYDQAVVEAFLASAEAAIEAFATLNDGLTGTIAGPHLWPHGFDIATEWISDREVSDGGETGHAQIATGWYPGEDAYVYVNPWPFSEDFAEIELPAGATWNTEGWHGAKLGVPRDGCLQIDDVVALAAAVHEATAGRLGR